MINDKVTDLVPCKGRGGKCDYAWGETRTDRPYPAKKVTNVCPECGTVSDKKLHGVGPQDSKQS